MKKTYLTVRELSRPEEFDKCMGWIYCGIRTGLIRAEKAGNVFIVHRSECERIKADMPIISREEYRKK